jgi:histidinol-phosphate aminotransferase
MSYFRPNIDAMAGYVPGEQPAPGSRTIKLNTNENPYPPSPQAMAVLPTIDPEYLRRYPHPMAQAFREAAGKALDISPDWILVGNGSDDLLTMIMRACIEPGRRVVYPMPTYVLYRTLAQIQDAEVIEVPFPDDYTLPIDELVNAEGAVTFVASPNSPSGTGIPIDLLDKLAAQVSGILVIDEAYVDFADETALPLTQQHDNVIVLRTLSKGYSLAGLRLGFGVAHPTLLAGLAKVKDSYNVDAIACLMGSGAIADQAYKKEMANRVKRDRHQMVNQFTQLGFKVWESQANFVLVQPAGVTAETLYQGLKQRGILVRYFQQPRLADKLRITVGTPEQNQQLLDAIQEVFS